MNSYQELFAVGEAFEPFVSRALLAEIAAVRSIQQQLGEPGAVSLASQQRLQALKDRYHLLVAAEMWCPDCQINVSVMADLQRYQPNIGLAIITKGRAEDELKARLALERISIPFVLVLDAQFNPVGRFIERPQAVIEGGDALKPDYRAGKYLESTVTDLLDIFEAAERAAG